MMSRTGGSAESLERMKIKVMTGGKNGKKTIIQPAYGISTDV